MFPSMSYLADFVLLCTGRRRCLGVDGASRQRSLAQMFYNYRALTSKSQVPTFQSDGENSKLEV
jgi:hypothetical protein